MTPATNQPYANVAARLSALRQRSSDRSATPEDWCDVKLRQEAGTSLPSSVGGQSLESLRTSVIDGLHALANDWDAMVRDLHEDINGTTLPNEFAAIAELAEFVMSDQRAGLPGIDGLIGSFESAVDKIYRSRQLPWGSWRTVGSQKAIVDFEALTPNAKAALRALSHLDRALKVMLKTLQASQCLDNASTMLQARHFTPEEHVNARRKLAAGYAVIGRLLRSVEPRINDYLTQAASAVPEERRRWKTKIAILLGLSFLTAALGLSSVFLSPILPALIGLALGLKLGATLTGLLATANGIFSMVGYSRNPGWDELAYTINRVRNLNESISGGMLSRQHVEQGRETEEARETIAKINGAIVRAKCDASSVVRRLGCIDDALIDAASL